MLDAFGALVGTWTTEARHRLVDDVVTGTTTFEWLEGRRFLLVRSHSDHDLFPDGISVIGPPEEGDGLVMEYFDSRGVRRTYGVALEDGVWRSWRIAPGFAQRFSATIAPDAFDGVFELAEAPGEWQEDMRVTYRRVAS